MMKNRSFSAIPSLLFVMMTFVYALLSSAFLDLDQVIGEEDFTVDFLADNINKIPSQQIIYMSCESPCPPSAEMCIQMCA